MIRYYTRNDGTRTLQWYDLNTWLGHNCGKWIDVPEITENDELITEQQELERLKKIVLDKID